ncbi:50S ribosomal protein L17 [Candidatus Kaiserbacteria bacterium]|nr:MAG: 50S ribosomal protein L17 [Candidatus Kaiserbacteria bacterium]PCI90489.1 MAG: 50S ribosomal protein L17 [Candidatus Kaiserbacteria bacterium]
MKHHKKKRSLGRVRKVRTALLRSLVRSLVIHERIETTIAKARELRPQIEKLITLAKKDTLASRRVMAARMGNDTQTTKKIHDELAPRFKERPGGYTRISKLGTFEDVKRDKAIIEFV